MTLKELQEKMNKQFPNGSVDKDETGQVVVYTGLFESDTKSSNELTDQAPDHWNAAVDTLLLTVSTAKVPIQ